MTMNDPTPTVTPAKLTHESYDEKFDRLRKRRVEIGLNKTLTDSDLAELSSINSKLGVKP